MKLPYNVYNQGPDFLNAPSSDQWPQNNSCVLPSSQFNPTCSGAGMAQGLTDLSSLPMTNEATAALSDYLDIPIPMALMAIIGGEIACSMRAAQVKQPRGFNSSMTIPLLMLAPPAAGKSPSVNIAMQGITELEDDLMESLVEANPEYKSEDVPQLIHDDVTTSGFVSDLKATGNLILLDTESSNSFENWTNSTITTINKGHDGDTIRISKGGVKPVRLKVTDPRIFPFLAQQGSVFQKLLKKAKGRYLLDSGFLERFLIYWLPDHAPSGNESHIDIDASLAPYRARQKELLVSSFASGYEPLVLTYEPAATEISRKIRQEISIQCQNGGAWENEKEHAGKLENIIHRLSGVFHLFEGFDGPISANTLWVAYQVVLQYSSCRQALFNEPDPVQSRADKIDSEFTLRFRNAYCNSYSPDFRYHYYEALKAYLPSDLRKKDEFHDAMRVLQSRNLVAVRWEEKANGRKGKRYVDLLPWIPPSLPQGLVLGGYAL